MTDKTDGEQRRERIVEILGEKYGNGLVSRAALALILSTWGDAHLDNALHVLKKRNIVYKGPEGYELTTAPAGYNERLVAERNASGEKAPEAVKVSPLDEKPFELPRKVKPVVPPQAPTPAPVKISNAGYSGTSKADPCDSCDNPKDCFCGGDVKPAVLPADFDPVIILSAPVPPPPPAPAVQYCATCGIADDTEGGRCGNKFCASNYTEADNQAPAGIDPVAVRAALGKLQVRLTVDRVVIDKELKLEVLDYLGRILDDSIEAVLVSIAGDLTK